MMERIQVYMSSGNCQACQLWYYDAKDNMRNFDNLALDSRGDLLNLPMSMLPKQKKKEPKNPQDTSSVEQAGKKLLKWLGQNENAKLDDLPKEARMKMMERFVKEEKNEGGEKLRGSKRIQGAQSSTFCDRENNGAIKSNQQN